MHKFTRRNKKGNKKGNKKNRTYKIGGANNPDEQRKGIVDIASKKIGEATLIDNVNEVLDSQVVSETVKAAAEETAEITGKLAKNFNDAMNNPQVRQEVEEAINHASDIGSIVIKSSEKPLQEAVKVGVESGTKAIGAASAGIIKIGTDAMAAVPGVGAIIEFGKILNDGSKAASAVVEAGTEAISIASDSFIETSENVKEGLKELEQKKKMVQQISNRTTKSIDDFVNPLNVATQSAGRRKTKRRFFKRKSKSHRVRFAV
jgi:hypothetical protein